MTPNGSFSLKVQLFSLFCKIFVRPGLISNSSLLFFVSPLKSKYQRLCCSVSVQMVALAVWRQRRRRCRTTGWSVWTTWLPLSSNWSIVTRRCTPAGTFWPSSQTTSRPSSGQGRWGLILLCYYWEKIIASARSISFDPYQSINDYCRGSSEKEE